jgi:hypothetical protein
LQEFWSISITDREEGIDLVASHWKLRIPSKKNVLFSDTTLTRLLPENIPQKHLPQHIIQHSVKTKMTISSATAALKT